MKKFSLLLLIVFFAYGLQGQVNPRLDSLKLRLNHEKTDTGKVSLYYRIAYELQFSNTEEALAYARTALSEAERIKFRKGIANALIQLGNIDQIKGNYDESEKYNQRALEIFREAKDQYGIAIAYNNLGILAHNRSRYSEALDLYRKSLEISRKIKNNTGVATSMFCIGTIHENLTKDDSALVYYLEAQTIVEEIGDKKLTAYAKTSLASIYYKMGSYLNSFNYYLEAAELFEKEGNDYGSLKVYTALGQTAILIDSIDLGLRFYKKGLAMSQKLNSQSDIATIYFALGMMYENISKIDSAYSNYANAQQIYAEMQAMENSAMTLIAMARILNLKQRPDEALKLLEEARAIGLEIMSPNAITEVYRELAMTWSYKNDFRKAYDYLNRYSETRDSVLTMEKQRQILELQTQFETERKEKENELLKKDQRILETTRNSLIIGALLLATIIVIIFNNLKKKKRDNQILREQRDKIAEQKKIVELQKTSIEDSIRYARRIQSAMLPPQKIIDTAIPDSFVLYLPRDIVSGDFYWIRQISPSRVLVCAADSTGHGVPGALMSMLGMSLLSDIISRNYDAIIDKKYTPGDILSSLRESIKNSLRQTGEEGESRDGMDVSICIIDRDSGAVTYSGANSPMYWVDNVVLNEIKPTKNPIGIYPNETMFTNHDLVLKKGSVIYMFSDGYYDQIGGEGRKFLSKNFKIMLSEISHLPAMEIKEKLLQTHLSWKSNEEQVDDILVIGVRI